MRGIVAGEVIRRVTAKTIAQQLGPVVKAATVPFQCARWVGVEVGAEVGELPPPSFSSCFFLSLSRTSLLRSTHLKVVILAGVLGKSKEAPATKQDGRLPRPLGGNTSTFELWSQVKVRRPRRLPSLGACHPRGVRAGGHAVVSTS